MYWYLPVLNLTLKSICLKGPLSAYFDITSKSIVYLFKLYLGNTHITLCIHQNKGHAGWSVIL